MFFEQRRYIRTEHSWELLEVIRENPNGWGCSRIVDVFHNKYEAMRAFVKAEQENPGKKFKLESRFREVQNKDGWTKEEYDELWRKEMEP